MRNIVFKHGYIVKRTTSSPTTILSKLCISGVTGTECPFFLIQNSTNVDTV